MLIRWAETLEQILPFQPQLLQCSSLDLNCGSFEFDHYFLLCYKQLIETVTFADLVSQIFGEKEHAIQHCTTCTGKAAWWLYNWPLSRRWLWSSAYERIHDCSQSLVSVTPLKEKVISVYSLMWEQDSGVSLSLSFSFVLQIWSSTRFLVRKIPSLWYSMYYAYTSTFPIKIWQCLKYVSWHLKQANTVMVR